MRRLEANFAEVAALLLVADFANFRDFFVGVGRFSQSLQTHRSEHAMPALKHSQYFLTQPVVLFCPRFREILERVQIFAPTSASIKDSRVFLQRQPTMCRLPPSRLGVSILGLNALELRCKHLATAFFRAGSASSIFKQSMHLQAGEQYLRCDCSTRKRKLVYMKTRATQVRTVAIRNNILLRAETVAVQLEAARLLAVARLRVLVGDCAREPRPTTVV